MAPWLHLGARTLSDSERPSLCLLQAKESGSQVNIVIDREDVLAKLQDLLKRQDLSRYVL